MKGIILKTAMALCLSAGVTAAMAQTEQPEVLKKQEGQPSQDTQKPSGGTSEGQAGTEPPVNPSKEAPAEQQQPSGQQPSGEQGGSSGTMKSDEQKGTKQPSGQSSQPADQTGQQPTGQTDPQSGTTTDQKTDRPTTEGTTTPEQKPASGSETTKQGQSSGTTVNITTEQRTEIKQVITETRVEPVRDIDIDISVGVAVPRTIEVHRLPPRIIKIVPDYEGYLYFVLADGRIVIVDPDSYEIVAILA